MKRTTLNLVLAGILGLSSSIITAQNIGINNTGSKPSAAAILDLQTGNVGVNRGFLPPEVNLTATNSAAPVTNPDIGLIVFNAISAGTAPYNVVPGYYYWDGTEWDLLLQPGGAGSAGQVLTSNGGGAPSWSNMNSTLATNNIQNASSSSVVSITNGAGQVVGSTNVVLDITDPASNNGGVLYSNGSGSAQFTVAGSSGQVLMSNGSGAPTWATAASLTMATLTNGTGITGSPYNGSTPETWSVTYGSTSGTAAQGNTQFTVNAGTGMSGGGTITEGAGGSLTLTNTGVTSITATSPVTASASTGGVTIGVLSNGLNTTGVVAGPLSSNANEVWGTNGSGSPSWEHISTSLITGTHSIVPGSGSSVVITNGTGQVIGATNASVDVQGTSGGVFYGTGAGPAAFNSAGSAGELLYSNGSGAPAWTAATYPTGTLTSNGLLYATSSTSVAQLAPSATANYVLATTTANGPPVWSNGASFFTGSFILNQSSSQQTGNYWIGGPAAIGATYSSTDQLLVSTPTAANIAILGQNTANSGSSTGTGVEGTTIQSGGYGVYGKNTYSGSGYGVYGSGYSGGVYATGSTYGSSNHGGTYSSYNSGGTYGSYNSGGTYGSYNTGSSYGIYGAGSLGLYTTGSYIGIYLAGGSSEAIYNYMYGTGTYGTYNYAPNMYYGNYNYSLIEGSFNYSPSNIAAYNTGAEYGAYNQGEYGAYNYAYSYYMGSYNQGSTYGAYASGSDYGVYGYSSSGYGVWGNGAYGVTDSATEYAFYNPTSATYGYYSSGNPTYGIYIPASSSYGAFIEGTTNAVVGNATASSGTGVIAYNNNGVTYPGLLVYGTSQEEGVVGLGLSSTYTGSMAWNSTSGKAVVINSGQTSTSYTLTLPTAAPSYALNVLTSTTGGVLGWTQGSTIANANNGTNINSGTLQLGGNLVKNTVVNASSSNYTMAYDLGTGSSAGTGTFSVSNGGTGNTYLTVQNQGVSGNPGQVGIGTAAPNSSAALDVSSTTAGMLFPRFDSVQVVALGTPANGLVLFNTTTNCLELYANQWVNLSCGCNPPRPPASMSGPTLICGGSGTFTFTCTASAGATSYKWSISPTITGTSIVGSTSTPTTTATFTSTAANYTITVEAVNGTGCPSGPTTYAVGVQAPANVTAAPSGNSTPTVNTSNTYTIAAVSGAIYYKWSVSNTYASITSGQGTTSVQIASSAYAGSYSICVYDSTAGGCVSTPQCLSVTSSCPAAPGSISGPSAPLISANSTYTIAAVAGATGYKWSVSNTNLATIYSGQGSTSLTISCSSTAGTFTICVYDSTNPGGCVSSSTCLTVTSSSCSPVVVLDAVSGSAPTASTGSVNTVSLTTTAANEIIVIYAEGDMFSASAMNCTVAVTGPSSGSATMINYAQGMYGGIAMFAFAAPTSGTYSCAVTENSLSTTYAMNFAASYKGFCSTPTVSGNVVSSTTTDYQSDICTTSESQTVTTSVAGSVIATGYGDATCSGSAGTITWNGATNLGSTFISGGEDGSNSYTSASSASTYTITINDASGQIGYYGLASIIIHP